MALKLLIKNLDEVPEAIRGEYTKQEDGTYLLGVEEKDYKEKLDEFRTNNRELFKQREQLTKDIKKFEGIDPEKYRLATEALGKLDEQEDANLLKAGKVEEVFNKRTGAMKTDYENKLTAKEEALVKSTKEAGTYRDLYRDLKLNQEVAQTIEGVGNVRKGALPDVMARAKQIFQLDDQGQLVAKNDKGEAVYGKQGEPLTLQEWSSNLLQSAAHLFEQAAGGGAKGGRQNDGVGTIIKGQLVNPTPQQFGRNLKDIASGKVEVVRPDQQANTTM